VKLLIIIVYALAIAAAAQERFEHGALKGFSKSPNEHEIIELDEPFLVRRIQGVVVDPTGTAVEGVLVEIRDKNGKIFAATTAEDGSFRIRAKPGTYTFKTTFESFKSITGVIEVVKEPRRYRPILIEIPPGT
jgi:hypothetical protein